MLFVTQRDQCDPAQCGLLMRTELLEIFEMHFQKKKEKHAFICLKREVN